MTRKRSRWRAEITRLSRRPQLPRLLADELPQPLCNLCRHLDIGRRWQWIVGQVVVRQTNTLPRNLTLGTGRIARPPNSPNSEFVSTPFVSDLQNNQMQIMIGYTIGCST